MAAARSAPWVYASQAAPGGAFRPLGVHVARAAPGFLPPASSGRPYFSYRKRSAVIRHRIHGDAPDPPSPRAPRPERGPSLLQRSRVPTLLLGRAMADVASRFLIQALIAKNEHRLAGRLLPPRRVSLYRIYEETIRLRGILTRHQANLIAAAAAKRKRPPYPSDRAHLKAC
jgi:hypothetical protein